MATERSRARQGGGETGCFRQSRPGKSPSGAARRVWGFMEGGEKGKMTRSSSNEEDAA